MVDISDKVQAIRKHVDAGKYFTINRARQYGKTTTINALCAELKDQYTVLSLDFQDIENGSFSDGGEFSQTFARIVLDTVDFDGFAIPDNIKDGFIELKEQETSTVKMDDLFRIFRMWFKEEENASLYPFYW